MDLINHKPFREFIILSCLHNSPEGLNIHKLLKALNDFFPVDEVELFLSLQKLLKESRIKGVHNSELMQVLYVLTNEGRAHYLSLQNEWDDLQEKLGRLVE